MEEEEGGKKKRRRKPAEKKEGKKGGKKRKQETDEEVPVVREKADAGNVEVNVTGSGCNGRIILTNPINMKVLEATLKERWPSLRNATKITCVAGEQPVTDGSYLHRSDWLMINASFAEDLQFSSNNALSTSSSLAAALAIAPPPPTIDWNIPSSFNSARSKDLSQSTDPAASVYIAPLNSISNPKPGTLAAAVVQSHPLQNAASAPPVSQNIGIPFLPSTALPKSETLHPLSSTMSSSLFNNADPLIKSGGPMPAVATPPSSVNFNNAGVENSINNGVPIKPVTSNVATPEEAARIYQEQISAGKTVGIIVKEACRRNDVEFIRWLINNRHFEPSQPLNENGHTLLHVAAIMKSLDLTKLAMNAGVDVNASSLDKLTPLYVAASSGSTPICEALLKAGASVSTVNSAGLTPLHQAVDRGHYDIVNILLEHGADVNVKDDKGRSAVAVALRKRNPPEVERVKQILQNIYSHSVIDWTQKTIEGKNLAHLAAGHGFEDFLKVIIKEQPLLLGERSNDDSTPLLDACIEGKYNEINLLLNSNWAYQIYDLQEARNAALKAGHHNVTALITKKLSAILEQNNTLTQHKSKK